MEPEKAMQAQFYFQRRLKDHGVTIHFTGITDIPSRWEQIRAAIVGSRLEDTVIGERKGSRETYREAFERATETALRQESAA